MCLFYSTSICVCIFQLQYIAYIFKGCKFNFFLHFSNMFIHQIVQFYSYLFSKGFYKVVCSYAIHQIIYNILFIPKNMVNFFLSLDSIFWFMEWWKEKCKILCKTL